MKIKSHVAACEPRGGNEFKGKHVVYLHGFGAVAGGDEALLFSHKPLIGNPWEESQR